jgi:hypothetical protein
MINTKNSSLGNQTLEKPIPSVDLNAPLKVEQEDQEEDNEFEKNNKRIFIFGSIIACLILISTGGVFFMYSRQPQEEKIVAKDQDKAQMKEVAKPTKPELNRVEISFEVLNGSGVAGEGKKAADKITGLGYTVSTTGNADNYDYKESELWLKKDFEDKADLILADLKKEFKNISFSGELKDTSAAARLILGKKDVE